MTTEIFLFALKEARPMSPGHWSRYHHDNVDQFYLTYQMTQLHVIKKTTDSQELAERHFYRLFVLL